MILFDKITNFAKKKTSASSIALKLYILGQKHSLNGYEFVWDMKIFALLY